MFLWSFAPPLKFEDRTFSSAVEHHVHIVGVAGSNPAMSTTSVTLDPIVLISKEKSGNVKNEFAEYMRFVINPFQRLNVFN